MKRYLGIDIGGTFIKGAVVEESGKILADSKIATEASLGSAAILNNISSLCDELLALSALTTGDISGIGIGVPGLINAEAGTIVYSDNLGLRDFELAKNVSTLYSLPVKIANDANAAALGEAKFGVGKLYKNIVMLTLGTGVGGGIIIDGKIVEGNCGAGAELGHSVIDFGGELCSCGRRGCLEAYASATALIRDTKRAMQKNPDSLMWQIGSLDMVTGKTPFDFSDKDVVARSVTDAYIEKLACGIVNFSNTLRPEAIILGGGVCAQGDSLIRPLKKILDAEIYAEKRGPEVKLLVAELGNKAGSLGAAALFMD